MYVVLIPGRQMIYSADAGYLGLAREFPITRTLSLEANADAGFAAMAAHGIRHDFMQGSGYLANNRVNFSFGIGAGVSAKLTQDVRLVGAVSFFDLGRAETGISTGLLGSTRH